MFPNYFPLTEEKADLAVFVCDSGHIYCQLKHSRTIFFQLDFLGLICYLAQTLEDPEEPEEFSAGSHIKPVLFLDSATGSYTSTHNRESTPGIYSLLDTQKCNRHKQLPGKAPWVLPFATLPCNKSHLFMNIPFTKITLIWLSWFSAGCTFCLRGW